MMSKRCDRKIIDLDEIFACLNCDWSPEVVWNSLLCQVFTLLASFPVILVLQQPLPQFVVAAHRCSLFNVQVVCHSALTRRAQSVSQSRQQNEIEL